MSMWIKLISETMEPETLRLDLSYLEAIRHFLPIAIICWILFLLMMLWLLVVLEYTWLKNRRLP